MSAKKSATEPAQKKVTSTAQKRAKPAPEVNKPPAKAQKAKPVTQRELLDTPAPQTCPQGGEHEWTDDECVKCHEPKRQAAAPAPQDADSGVTEDAPASAGGKKRPAKTPKNQSAPQSKKMSALDAAAKILAEAGRPMSTREMIEAMAAKGYWSSPNGQTPAATLYSAILRQINATGKDARFKKVDRGQFSLNG